MVKYANKLDKLGHSEDLFRTIGDVSSELKVPTHVLRFWESKFSGLKPLKRKGGHRYYRTQDVELIIKIKDLLYSEGYTIKGAQKFLNNIKKGIVTQSQEYIAKVEEGKPVAQQESLFEPLQPKPKRRSDDSKVKSFINELESIKDMLNSD